jgi:hypothetical protein
MSEVKKPGTRGEGLEAVGLDPIKTENVQE